MSLRKNGLTSLFKETSNRRPSQHPGKGLTDSLMGPRSFSQVSRKGSQGLPETGESSPSLIDSLIALDNLASSMSQGTRRDRTSQLLDSEQERLSGTPRNGNRTALQGLTDSLVALSLAGLSGLLHGPRQGRLVEAPYQCCLALRTEGRDGFWPAKAKTSIQVWLLKAENPGV